MPTISKAIANVVAAVAAGAVTHAVAAPDRHVTAFLQHPTHCSVMTGGDGYQNESVSADYATHLAKALGAVKDNEGAVLSLLEAGCSAQTRDGPSEAARHATSLSGATSDSR